MNNAESVQDYAQKLGKYRVKLKYQIPGYLEEAQASPQPNDYLNHLGYAVFITGQMLDSTKQVGTTAEYRECADIVVDRWCKPII